jgi:hypothetical protein
VVLFAVFVSGDGLVVASGAGAVPVWSGVWPASFLRQPWIRSAIRTITLKLIEKSTTILSRARALFFCSRKELWGRNGLGLFIVLARVASFL